MLALLVVTTLFATTFASYGANLNYRSPSQHHPGLGINLRKVVKRSNPGSKWGKETTPHSLIFYTLLRYCFMFLILFELDRPDQI